MALNGSEILQVTGLTQGGPSGQSFFTTTQAIANLGGGGGGGITATLVALENLSAGDLVNITSSGGQAQMQRANATDTSKPADGFVASAVSSGSLGAFTGGGAVNGSVSGLTPGARYYLSTSAGQITATPPSSTGNAVQEVGYALSATSLAFFPKTSVGL